MANTDVTIKVAVDTGSFTKDMKQLRTMLKDFEQDGKILDKQLQQNGSRIEQLSGRYDNLRQRLAVQSTMTEKYRQHLEKLEQRQKKNIDSLEAATKAYDEGKKQLEKNSDELNKLRASYEKAKRAVDSTASSYDTYHNKLKTSIKDEKLLQIELDKTGDDLKKQQGYITRVNDAYKSMQEKTAGVRSALSSAGRTLTTGVTLPLVAAGGAAIKYASDLEESQNKVDVSFGKSAAVVSDFAKTTNEMYGIAEGTALDMASLFGDMGTSMGLPQDEAALMSKTLVGLAGDLSSFKNIGLDQVTTGLKGIFTGETESLKELGVVMTEANLEAYALSNGIEKNIDDMTQAEKINLRYQYVLDVTKNAQGDYARTADSTANSLRTFRESTKELAASFGTELLPVITPVIQGATDMVKSFGDLDEGQKQMILKLAGVAAAAGPVLSVASKGITVVNGISSAVKAAVGGMGGLSGGIKIASSVLKGLTSPLGLVTVGLTTLYGVTKYASEATERASDNFKNLGNEAKEANEKYEKTAENAEIIEELSDEWEDLNQKISDGKLSSEELESAEQRRKDIEKWFIDNYGAYITAEEQKNGIRGTTINKIKEVNSALLEQQKREAEIALNAVKSEIPDAKARIQNLESENEELAETEIKLRNQISAMHDLKKEYDEIDKSSMSSDQRARLIDEYTEKLRQATGIAYVEYGKIDTYIGQNESKIESNSDIMEKNNEILKTNYETLFEFVELQRQIGDIELNGQYDLITQSLLDLMDAYNEVTETGTITNETLGKIIDDVPEIENVANKPQALIDAILYLSTVLEDAGVDVDTLLLTLGRIKPEYNTTLRIKTIYERPIGPTQTPGMTLDTLLAQNATGTNYARRGLSVVNEKGPELIESRDGTFRMAQGSPALTYLEQGDKVYTAEQTKKMAKAGGIPNFAEGKSAFENARDAFRHRQRTSEVSMLEELAWWQNILKEYESDADAVKEANEEIYQLSKDLKKEQSDDYKSMVSDLISEDERWNNRQKELGTISQNDYLWNLGNRADQYRKFADEVMTLDYMTEEERLNLRKEYIQKAEDLDLEYYEQWKQMASDALAYQREQSDTYLSDRAFYSDWGADDPFAAYERIKEQEAQAVADGLQTWDEYDKRMAEVGKTMYDDGVNASFKWIDQMEKYGVLSDEEYLAALERIRQDTDEYYKNGLLTNREYAEAIERLNDKEFDRYKQLLDEQVDAYYDAQQQQLDARKQAIEDAYAAEEKAEQQAERKAQLQELLEQERIFAGAVTIEGKQKLEDIRSQIADIEKQQRNEQREAEKEAQLDAIEEQQNMLDKQHEQTLQSTNKFTAQMVGVIEGGNQELSNAFSNLMKQQIENQKAIFEEGYRSLSQIVNAANAKMAELITFNGNTFAILGQSQPSNTGNSYMVNQNITNYVSDRTEADAFASSINRAAWKSMYVK